MGNECNSNICNFFFNEKKKKNYMEIWNSIDCNFTKSVLVHGTERRPRQIIIKGGPTKYRC